MEAEIVGKQSSNKSEINRNYSVHHVELADFLKEADNATTAPPEMAVEALVWKSLQGTFQGKEVGTMPYLTSDVPHKDKMPEVQLNILRNFLSSGSIHLAIVPKHGILLANMAAVHMVAQAGGG